MTLGLWNIIVPEAGKNYIQNPSLEVGTTGYSDHATGTASGTRARSSTWQRREAYSYKLVKSGGGAADEYGTYNTPTNLSEFVSGDSVTFSVDLYVEAGTAEIKLTVTAGSAVSQTLEVAEGSDGRYTVTVGPLGATATDIKAYVYIKSATGTVYADGWQVERTATQTSYMDGNQPGCTWDGAEHASTSTRSAQERSGGREYNIRDTYGWHITTAQGVGMPPIKHQIQDYAQMPGALYRGETVEPRLLALVSDLDGTTRANLHEQRKDLIDLLKPDRVTGRQPVRLRYTGANSAKKADLYAYYDAGLGFAIQSEDGNREAGIPLRLSAYDPFFYEDGNRAADLTPSLSVANANYVIQCKDGVWSALGTGMNNGVYAIARSPSGTFYLAGTFTTADGDTHNRVVEWDPITSTFTALGTGFDAAVWALAVAPDGTLYAGGVFTTADGNAAACIAKWSGSAWSAIGAGLTGGSPAVWTLVFGPDGKLYIGGAFTTAGGGAAANVCSLTGTTYTALGSGLNNTVRALAVAPDGTVYAGGQFTNVTSTYDYIAEFDGSAWAALSTGATGIVYALALDVNGDLIVGGAFDSIGGVTCYRIARWNKVNFEPIGPGLSSTVYRVTVGNGGIYAAGEFTKIGSGTTSTGNFAEHVAFFNSKVWTHLGLTFSNSSTISWAIYAQDDYLLLGFTEANTCTASALTTVTNTGTATTYPKIVIKRSGGTSAQVQLIKNETTGAALYLEYSLLDGEELTIDLTPGARSCVSSFWGSVWRAILRNSNEGDFYLLPGTNVISVYVKTTGSPTLTCYMQWRVCHWSADGVAL